MMTPELNAAIEAMHAALDLDPSNQGVRGMLADAYADAGEYVWAHGLAEMAALGLRPDEFRRGADDNLPWGWWQSHWEGIPRGSVLAADVWSVMNRNAVAGRGWWHPTRREAELAFCEAWADLCDARARAQLYADEAPYTSDMLPF